MAAVIMDAHDVFVTRLSVKGHLRVQRSHFSNAGLIYDVKRCIFSKFGLFRRV